RDTCSSSATPMPSAMSESPPINLRSPEFYLNRELSLLEFNRRVQAQARDPEIPLLERLQFLCIASANLDEFFEIRVAGLKQQAIFSGGGTGADNLGPIQQLNKISLVAHELVREQYVLLNDLLLPELCQHGIHILLSKDWNNKQSAWVKSY